MGLPGVVLTLFVSVHNMFSIDYHGRLVEALLECISDQSPSCGTVPIDPTMDITQQLLPLFNGDVAL